MKTFYGQFKLKYKFNYTSIQCGSRQKEKKLLIQNIVSELDELGLLWASGNALKECQENKFKDDTTS